MSTPTPDSIQRDELLAGRALGDLSPAEAATIDRLLLADGDDDGFDLLAARLDLALSTSPAEVVPASLRRGLETAADLFLAESDAAAPEIAGRVTPSTGSAFGAMGWIAAAACLVLAVLAWVPLGATVGSPSGSATFASVSARPDALTVGLSADLAGEQPIGSLVWSKADQVGVMRFEGLPVLDPSKEVYQLWIFDGSREPFNHPLDIRHPVDGGVFTITGGSGAVEVPISAKLPVGSPVLFAVTIEKPGGVVVSDRSRIAAVGIPG